VAAVLLGCGGGADVSAPAAAPERSEAAAPSSEERKGRRAVWVLAEGSQRVLENPDRIATLLDHASQLGASDLFVQVYRGGRAWFDSSHADASPYQVLVGAHGRDTLVELIDRAHASTPG
jgi:uncharacterized lipoprotein YddW (UPF0748 family)